MAASKKGASRAQAKSAQAQAVVPAKVAPAQAPVAKSAAHLAATRKTGLQLGAATKLALTAYGLASPNPWGKGKGGEFVYVALKAAGKAGITLEALEAQFGKGKRYQLPTNASVRDHLRYLYCWGHSEKAYLAVDGKTCPPFEYGVRPAH